MKKPFCVEDIAVGILLVFGFLGIFYIFTKGTNAMTMRQNSVSRDVNREVVEIEYKGHQYLQYKYSIEHNPDCPCHTNKIEVTK